MVRSASGITVDTAGFDLDAFASLGGAEGDRGLVGVEAMIRRLQVCRAEMIQVVASSGSFVDDGHRSAHAWVAAVLNTSPASASRLVRTAHVLAEVPALADAHRAGTVGSDQVDEFRRLHANPACRAELESSGHRLVVPAERLTFSDFRHVVARWRAHVDPDGSHRDHARSRTRRHVRFGTAGHEGIIHAEGDAASVDEMVDILKAHVESELLQDCEERRIRHGEQADGHPLRRTHGQRCYDALQEIFRKAAGTGVPGVNKPTVNILTTESALIAAIRDYFRPETGGATETDEAEPPVPIDVGFSETENGSPVHPDDMVVAALLGRIRSVIVADDGRLLHAGSRARLFTGRIRDMILLLGRHRCGRHGCNNSGPSIQVDHAHSFSCGGCTTAGNGGPLCPIHNREKFRLRRTVTHDRYGWHHFRPDGTEITPRGP